MKHYQKGEVECIQALRSALSSDEYIGFLKGNVFKYLWRADHKGNANEDFMKAMDYMRELEEVLLESVQQEESNNEQ